MPNLYLKRNFHTNLNDSTGIIEAGSGNISYSGGILTLEAPNDGSVYQYTGGNLQGPRIWQTKSDYNAKTIRRDVLLNDYTLTGPHVWMGTVNGDLDGRVYGSGIYIDGGLSERLIVYNTSFGVFSFNGPSPGKIKILRYYANNDPTSWTLPEDGFILPQYGVAWYYSLDGIAFTRYHSEYANISQDTTKEWGVFARTWVAGTYSKLDVGYVDEYIQDDTLGMDLPQTPEIVFVSPISGSSGADRSAPIKFSLIQAHRSGILDTDISVSLSDLSILVNGSVVYDGATDTFDSNWSGSSYLANLWGGQDFILIPDANFLSENTVNISVEGQNTIGDTFSNSWSFSFLDGKSSGSTPAANLQSLSELPKMWTPYRCASFEYSANTVTLQPDGVRISLSLSPGTDGNYQASPWYGLKSAGISYPGDADIDIDCGIIDMNFSSSNVNWAGIGLCLPGVLRAGSVDQQWISCRFDDHYSTKTVQLVSFTAYPNAVIHASASIPSNTTSGRLRIVKNSSGFEGFYDIGAGWVSLGVFSVSAFNNPEIYLEPAMMMDKSSSAGAYAIATYTDFNKSAGIASANTLVQTPSDEFSDSTIPTMPRYVKVKRYGASALNVEEIIDQNVGKLRFHTTRPEGGFVSTFALFPGTDIAVEIKAENITPVVANAGIGITFLNEKTDEYCDKSVSLMFVAISGGVEWRLIVNNKDGSGRAAGYLWYAPTVGQTGSVGASPVSSTATLRREGSIWNAYLESSPTPFATWQDTTGYMTDVPLVPMIWRKVNSSVDENLHYVRFLEGDWASVPETNSPTLNNLSPAPSSGNQPVGTSVALCLQDDSGVDESTIAIDVNGETVTGSPFAPGWTSSTITPDGSGGFCFDLVSDNSFPANSTIQVDVAADDIYGNALVQSYTFETGSGIAILPGNGAYRGHRFTLQDVSQVVRSPKVVQEYNQFDEHGSLLSLQRLKSEKNLDYKRRIQNAAAHLANSSYRGLINGITRELGLQLSSPIQINPKTDIFGNFLAPDPYIKFDNAWLYLYSDYRNNLLDYKINRDEPGGNYEHLGSLIDLINSTYFFEVSITSSIDLFDRSMTILNQSNRDIVRHEIIDQSTKFKLKHARPVKGSVFFSNRKTFKREVLAENLVTQSGDYFINYQNGHVTSFTIPNDQEYVKYTYIKFPFAPSCSPIILHDINSEEFKVKMFSQIINNDFKLTHGLPTELGVDIINELLSVTPLYWGV